MKPIITIELNTKAYATLNVLAEKRGQEVNSFAQQLLERAIMRESKDKRSYTQGLEDLIDDLCANVNEMKEILSREGY